MSERRLPAIVCAHASEQPLLHTRDAHTQVSDMGRTALWRSAVPQAITHFQLTEHPAMATLAYDCCARPVPT